jgi:hypothetical protein
MDGSRLRVGAGQLDSASKTGCGLGSGPLGASAWRLGLDRRPLAVRNRPTSCQNDDCQAVATAGHHQPKTLAKMSGATIVASDSMMNFGVSMFNLPQVIFSFGTAPEYDPKLVVESLIWQK